MGELVLTVCFADFWVIGCIESVMRHVVENFKSDYKSMIVCLLGIVEDRFVYYFDIPVFPQLIVIFLHKFFALVGQFR